MVELIIESGLLPDGCAAAGQRRRGRPARPPHRAGPARLHRLRLDRQPAAQRTPTSSPASVRFNAEADSLNCSILGPDAAPGHAGVRPLRPAAGHRDDRQGRAEVHRDPPRLRARRPTWTRSPRRVSRRAGQGRRRQPGRQVASRMGALASLDQREEVRRSLKALADAGHGRLRRPGARRGERRRRRPRRVPVPDPAARRRHEPRRAARGRGVRPGQHADRLRRHAGRHRAGRPRHGQPGRFDRHRTTRTSPATSSSALAPWHGRLLVLDDDDARRVHRPRLAAARCWCTAARAGPAAARRWAACAASSTTCSAPRSRPARGCSAAVTGRWVTGAPRRPRRRPPVHQAAVPAAHRRHRRRRAAHRDAGGHRALRRVHRRHLLRAHRRGGRGDEPVLRRPRRARLPDPVVRRRAVRQAGARVRCWPTTASTTCGSSPRSSRATR